MRLLYILFEKYTKKIRANLRFVKIDTSNGRFKRRYLDIPGLIERLATNSTAYSKIEADIYTFRDFLN